VDLWELSLHEARELLHKGEISSRQLTEAFFQRIEAVEPRIHAFITLTKESALAEADQADDRRRREAAAPPLLGIPLAIKDLISTRGVKTTCGSRILDNYVPPYDATAMVKLRAQGAVFLGKTNMDEFAMGSSTETSHFGISRNPWDPQRVPGGSSGGSAACVAARQCSAALGSDTGGSIRQPAAFCGIVGLKPTYGRVSRYGLVAYASSLDQIGPMTREVRDTAILLEAISGHDPRDSTSAPFPVPPYESEMVRGAAGLRVGIPKEYFVAGMDREVEEAVRNSVETLEQLGMQVSEVSLPHTEYAVATYYLLATAEASSNLARYDGVKYGLRSGGGGDLPTMYMQTRSAGFGIEVKRRIMLGTYALSAGYYDAYYLKAQKVRTLIKEDFDQVFQTIDVIATPTAPMAAFKLGEKIGDPLQMYLSDIFTIPVNLAGLPGLVLPCGFTAAGLPVGLQLIGRPFEETVLLRAGYAFEQATEWHEKPAPV